MKKSIVKTLYAFLVLALVLSVLPMAAFAAEIEGHEHTDACCTNDTAVMPAMATCADGDHIYSVYYTCLYVDCGGVHRSDEVIMYDCAYCAHSYYEYTGSYSYDAHSYQKHEQVGIDGGAPLYKYECTACHHIKYDK